MNIPVKDIRFIHAKQLGTDKDMIILRIPISIDDERQADALVRLDVQCYVDTDSEGDLLELLAKGGLLPRRFDEAVPDALKV